MIKLNVDSYSLVPKYSLLLISSLVLVSLALTACGQKGSLYLPKKHGNIINARQQTQQGHKQDKFVISPQIHQSDEETQKRIKEMQANPNDF